MPLLIWIFILLFFRKFKIYDGFLVSTQMVLTDAVEVIALGQVLVELDCIFKVYERGRMVAHCLVDFSFGNVDGFVVIDADEHLREVVERFLVLPCLVIDLPQMELTLDVVLVQLQCLL